MKEKPWIRKSMNEKRTALISKAHARPTFCLLCEVRVMPKDRAGHRDRCPGRLSPEGLDDWEPEESLMGRGVPVFAVKRLALRGSIRSREAQGKTEYLTRDVEQFLDARRLFG